MTYRRSYRWCRCDVVANIAKVLAIHSPYLIVSGNCNPSGCNQFMPIRPTASAQYAAPVGRTESNRVLGWSQMLYMMVVFKNGVDLNQWNKLGTLCVSSQCSQNNWFVLAMRLFHNSCHAVVPTNGRTFLLKLWEPTSTWARIYE